MNRYRYLLVLAIISIFYGIAYARSLTDNGVQQGDLVAYLTAQQTLINQLRTTVIALRVDVAACASNTNALRTLAIASGTGPVTATAISTTSAAVSASALNITNF